MSALGHKRTLIHVHMMSALPPKADIGTQSRDVRFVPKADIAGVRRQPVSVLGDQGDAKRRAVPFFSIRCRKKEHKKIAPVYVTVPNHCW